MLSGFRLLIKPLPRKSAFSIRRFITKQNRHTLNSARTTPTAKPKPLFAVRNMGRLAILFKMKAAMLNITWVPIYSTIIAISVAIISTIGAAIRFASITSPLSALAMLLEYQAASSLRSICARVKRLLNSSDLPSSKPFIPIGSFASASVIACSVAASTVSATAVSFRKSAKGEANAAVTAMASRNESALIAVFTNPF